ncbi:MAG: flavin reductase domain protein FMN-binding protein [Herbinix sp.]|jgi:flavin reductase (DIM6/NTAB) family NADH-FMN oxidoreductase RutF|nr:flavin reductase domain protein FMN-binding protein [Herbinix sp.]
MDKVKVDYEKMYYGFPVILISYYDKAGNANVTTLSSSYTLKDMVMLGFSSKGYAINQIKEVSDFVINIADHNLLEEIKICGKYSGTDCNKFEKANLTPIPSEVVKAPLIAECPINIECTLADIIESSQFEGITNVLATIKGRLVSETKLDENGRMKIAELDNVLYYNDGVNRGLK